MKLFASKDPFSKAFYQSKLALINKVKYLKNYLVPKKYEHVFLKVITKNIYSKL